MDDLPRTVLTPKPVEIRDTKKPSTPMEKAQENTSECIKSIDMAGDPIRRAVRKGETASNETVAEFLQRARDAHKSFGQSLDKLQEELIKKMDDEASVEQANS